jgi:hypothetical protein
MRHEYWGDPDPNVMVSQKKSVEISKIADLWDQGILYSTDQIRQAIVIT